MEIVACVAWQASKGEGRDEKGEGKKAVLWKLLL